MNTYLILEKKEWTCSKSESNASSQTVEQVTKVIGCIWDGNVMQMLGLVKYGVYNGVIDFHRIKKYHLDRLSNRDDTHLPTEDPDKHNNYKEYDVTQVYREANK